MNKSLAQFVTESFNIKESEDTNKEETKVEESNKESEEVSEAKDDKVETEADFKEYATKVLKKSHSDDYDEEKAKETIDSILKGAEGDMEKAMYMFKSSMES